MRRFRSRHADLLEPFTLVLTLLAMPGYSAPISYRAQPIAGLSTRFPNAVFTPDSTPEPGDYMVIDGLNDQGQLLFAEFGSQPALVLESDGHLMPVALPLGSTPDGLWPADLVLSNGSLNQQGQVAFSAGSRGTGEWLGTFLWDSQTQQSTPVAIPGLMSSAKGDLFLGGTYESTFGRTSPDFPDSPWASGAYSRPILNNRGEVAFAAPLSDSKGQGVGSGLFFEDADGQVTPIVLAGDTLPGAGTIRYVIASSLNDAGVVAFLASTDAAAWSAFTWANGKITPAAGPGQMSPGVNASFDVAGAWVNDVNQNVLIELGGQAGYFYLLEGDQLKPVATQNQAMPGGGLYRSALWPGFNYLVSGPNAMGQSLFIGSIAMGDHLPAAAYRIDANGALSLILQDGDTTDDGNTIRLGDLYFSFGIYGAALNSKGQIALPAQINSAPDRPGLAPATIALLTPTGS